VACLLVATPEARAHSFCDIRPTLDGFVALRKAPSPTAPLIGRIRKDDTVQYLAGQKGNWREVHWWRGQALNPADPHRILGRGWVNSRLIEEEC